jgi:D-alanyl-D-alanine carboxypeptidase
VVAVVGIVVAVAANGATSSQPTPTPTPTLPAHTPSATVAPPAPEPEQPPADPAGFDRAAHSLDDPTSPWVVVNKLRPITDGSNYSPPDLVNLPDDMPNPNGHQLRAGAAAALEEMFHAAANEVGTQLVAQSGYRSYNSQVNAYGYYVDQLGVAGADLTSARPGYSEHQTGMAMDILDTSSGCSVDGPCFGSSASGIWLAENAYRFGFILRYPADKTDVTGYEYEPWHFRWVGVDLATEMHNQGVATLEEFFGLPAAPTY